MKAWPDREVEVLRAMWFTHSKRDISERINRSLKAINAKASVIGLPPKRRRGIWTDEMTDTATSLLAKGHSCRQIGIHLGMTKNSVVGRMKRIGAALPLRTKKPKPTPKWGVYKANSRAKKAVVITMKKPVPPKPREDIGPPDNEAVHLLKRKKRQCAYPVGGHYFCGAPVWDKSYCEYHYAICHKKRA